MQLSALVINIVRNYPTAAPLPPRSSDGLRIFMLDCLVPLIVRPYPIPPHILAYITDSARTHSHLLVRRPPTLLS